MADGRFFDRKTGQAVNATVDQQMRGEVYFVPNNPANNNPAINHSHLAAAAATLPVSQFVPLLPAHKNPFIRFLLGAGAVVGGCCYVPLLVMFLLHFGRNTLHSAIPLILAAVTWAFSTRNRMVKGLIPIMTALVLIPTLLGMLGIPW